MYVIRRHTTLLDTRTGEMEERHYGQCIKTGPETYMVYGNTFLLDKRIGGKWDTL